MKFTEKTGEYELTYEGTPHEIIALQRMINPMTVTINNTLTDSDKESLKIYDEIRLNGTGNMNGVGSMNNSKIHISKHNMKHS